MFRQRESQWSGRCRRVRYARRGVEVVEFALVLPVLLLMGFGAIEFSRALTVQQVLTNAAREGARAGIVPNATKSDATNKVKENVTVGNIDPEAVAITVTPDVLYDATSGDDVNVRVQVPYMDVTWLPVPRFLGDVILSSECTMRHE